MHPSEFVSKYNYACWCGESNARIVCSQMFQTKFAVMECEECGTMRILPNALRTNSATAIYNRSGSRVYYAANETEVKVKIDTALRRMRSVGIRVAGQSSLLEIGCSDGAVLAGIQALTGSNCTGVDIDRRAIAFGQQRYPAVTFFEGDFSAASFSASKYDIIIASAIIEHVESPHDFLREAARLLKPNGQLFVLTPNTRSVTFRWLRSFWRELLAIGEHVYMFDQQSLERCARGSGLQLEGAVTDYDSARIDVKALRFTSLKHTCVSIFTVYIKVIKRLSMLLAGAQCGDLLIVSFRKRE